MTVEQEQLHEELHNRLFDIHMEQQDLTNERDRILEQMRELEKGEE